MWGQLIKKYITVYSIIGIISFLLVSSIGAVLLERDLTDDAGHRLYTEAASIAEDLGKNRISDADTLNRYEKILSSVADFEHAQIWYLNDSGKILLTTDSVTPEYKHKTVISGFDPIKLGKKYYTTGKFFNYFSRDMISVLTPLPAATSNSGYVAIHLPLQTIREQRDQLLGSVYKLTLLVFFVCFFVTLYLMLIITKPLNKILIGVKEYAAGNLNYEIPVTSDDELGTLSSTLNFMSDEMNKSVESQRNFISNVSHDFRSPLTSIKGYVAAILDGTIPHEMQEKYLNIVLNETKRLESLTQGILTLNDVDAPGYHLSYSHFDMNLVIRETAALFEGICRKRHITLELILFGSELYVHADYRKVQQILYNLLDNAIKFSKDHSSIQIETSTRRNKVSISVKDHGVGIPASAIPKIWERFYKLDSSRGKDTKGTGLGLAIVKELVNAHKQIITVVSTEGAGTEFSFSLERGQSPGSTSAAPPDASGKENNVREQEPGDSSQ